MIKPGHDTKSHVRPAKSHTSLGIRAVLSKYSLCAQWVANDPADSDDQTGPIRLSVFAGHTVILCILSCSGSIRLKQFKLQW